MGLITGIIILKLESIDVYRCKLFSIFSLEICPP